MKLSRWKNVVTGIRKWSSAIIGKGIAARIGLLVTVMMIIIAAMVGVNVVLSNKVKAAIHRVSAYDTQVSTLATQANIGFLHMDDESNKWLGLRTFSDKQLSKFTHQEILKEESQMDSSIKKLGAVVTQPSIQQLVKQTRSDATDYENYFTQAENYYQHDPTAAQQLIFVNSTNSSAALTNDLSKLVNDGKQLQSKDMAAATALSAVQTETMWIAGIITILLALFILFVIIRMIRPVPALSRAIEAVANGDLTYSEEPLKRSDEIGVMSQAVTTMVARMRDMMGQLRSTAREVAEAAEYLTNGTAETKQATENIATTMQEVASGAERQSISTDETARSISEMVSGIQQVSFNSQNVSESSSGAKSVAEHGQQSIERVITQMNSIYQTVSELSDTVRKLGDSSSEIGQMVGVITDISKQTNLLALNAAIEAAHAGEHGRGFAVVADEVRKLATQSAEKAQDIANISTNIRSNMDVTVETTESVGNEVETGLELANQSGDAFRSIVHSISDVSAQIVEVSASVEEMAAGAEQISQTVESVSQIAKTATEHTFSVSSAAEEQLASMQQISSSAISLSKMAEQLESLVAQFSV